MTTRHRIEILIPEMDDLEEVRTMLAETRVDQRVDAGWRTERRGIHADAPIATTFWECANLGQRKNLQLDVQVFCSLTLFQIKINQMQDQTNDLHLVHLENFSCITY